MHILNSDKVVQTYTNNLRDLHINYADGFPGFCEQSFIPGARERPHRRPPVQMSSVSENIPTQERLSETPG